MRHTLGLWHVAGADGSGMSLNLKRIPGTSPSGEARRRAFHSLRYRPGSEHSLCEPSLHTISMCKFIVIQQLHSSGEEARVRRDANASRHILMQEWRQITGSILPALPGFGTSCEGGSETDDGESSRTR